MSTKDFLNLADKIPVTRYVEYQDYLQAIYQTAKEALGSYSYLRFAEDLGFSATNVLRLVIARKRKLSEKSARTIAETLKLRHEDKKYFLNLVRYANVPSQETKAQIFLQIYKDKKSSIGDKSDQDLMEFYSAWYHPVILELVNLQTYSQEPEDLSKCIYPRVLSDQVVKTFELLKSLRMIQLDEKTRRWTGVDQVPRIVPEDKAAELYSLAQFHLQMMDIASQSLLLVPRQEREYNAMTIKVSTDQFPALKDRIREFCADIMAMEREANLSDRIVQVNVQMFPLTREVKKQEIQK